MIGLNQRADTTRKGEREEAAARPPRSPDNKKTPDDRPPSWGDLEPHTLIQGATLEHDHALTDTTNSEKDVNTPLEAHNTRETRPADDTITPKPLSPVSGTGTNLSQRHIQSTSPANPTEDIPATLLPDDINFPRLPSPARRLSSPPSRAGSPSASQVHTPPTFEITPIFVWRNKPPNEEIRHIVEPQTDKGKSKAKPNIPRIPDSTPITRQGYRTGRLTEDFWGALGIPNTPPFTRKTLQAIPVLTKEQLTEHAEYLVDQKTDLHSPVVQVWVAEQLAGIPWTPARARQHVVNEISQALHKVLIFNNNLSNPFQKWDQGRWFGGWTEDSEGEHTCTLFVSVAVLESKVKPRKGHNYKWRPVPVTLREQIIAHTPDTIASTEDRHRQWFQMTGKPFPTVINQNHTATSNTEASSSSAALLPAANER